MAVSTALIRTSESRATSLNHTLSIREPSSDSAKSIDSLVSNFSGIPRPTAVMTSARRTYALIYQQTDGCRSKPMATTQVVDVAHPLLG